MKGTCSLKNQPPHKRCCDSEVPLPRPTACVQAWSTQLWVCLRTLHGRHEETTWPCCVALSPDGELLASGSSGLFGGSTIKVGAAVARGLYSSGAGNFCPSVPQTASQPAPICEGNDGG